MANTLKTLAMLVGAAAIGVAPLALADDGPTAQMLAENCNGCHGTDGASAGPASPSIGGSNSEYFVETMKGYKEGKVPSTIMGRIAKGYSDADIEKMAGFFNGKKFVPAKQKFDQQLAKKGEKLHDKYCEKCHEDGGKIPGGGKKKGEQSAGKDKDKDEESSDEYQLLAGQWTPYLRWQMADFIAGSREMPKKMKQKVEQLREKDGDANLEAVLSFYASQQ